jgi:hypothetical protein
VIQVWYIEAAIGDGRPHYFCGNGVWSTNPDDMKYFTSLAEAEQSRAASIFNLDAVIMTTEVQESEQG